MEKFEGDLDGIDVNSMVTFKWTFTDSKSAINVSDCVVRRCGHVYYKGNIFPPWQVRAAACVVWALLVFAFGFFFVSCLVS